MFSAPVDTLIQGKAWDDEARGDGSSNTLTEFDDLVVALSHLRDNLDQVVGYLDDVVVRVFYSVYMGSISLYVLVRSLSVLDDI